MVNRPKIAGTNAESMVCDYLREQGWPYAKRLSLSGSKDVGDIDLHPALVLEVKATQGVPKIGPWMDETDAEQMRAGATYGILIIKYPGVGSKRVGEFLTVMRRLHAELLIAQARAVDDVLTFGYGIKQTPIPLLKNMDRQFGHPLMSAVIHQARGLDKIMDYHFMWLEDRVTLLRRAGYIEKRTMNGHEHADE